MLRTRDETLRVPNGWRRSESRMNPVLVIIVVVVLVVVVVVVVVVNFL